MLMGERYKMVTKETKAVLSGEYGATAKPFNPEVQKKCIGDKEPITCRPADLIPDELDTLRGEMAQWSQQDEDVLSLRPVPAGCHRVLQVQTGTADQGRPENGG